MKWLWFAAALVVAGLIVMCNMKQADQWLASQQPQQDVVQMAADLIQGNPTAAGKGGKK
jgi:hypothetical protein